MDRQTDRDRVTARYRRLYFLHTVLHGFTTVRMQLIIIIIVIVIEKALVKRNLRQS